MKKIASENNMLSPTAPSSIHTPGSFVSVYPGYDPSSYVPEEEEEEEDDYYDDIHPMESYASWSTRVLRVDPFATMHEFADQIRQDCERVDELKIVEAISQPIPTISTNDAFPLGETTYLELDFEDSELNASLEEDRPGNRIRFNGHRTFKSVIGRTRPSWMDENYGTAVIDNLFGVCGARRKGKNRTRPKANMSSRVPRSMPLYSNRVRSNTSFGNEILVAELRAPIILDQDFTIPGGSTTGSIRFNPNAVYQPIVGGATGALPGYPAKMLEWGFYRVMGYKYVIHFVNNEAFPVSVFVTNSDNDVGTTPAISVAANPLSDRRALGPLTGQCMTTIRRSVRVSEIAGTRAVAYGDSYRSLLNATPADVMWLGVSAASMTGTALSVSVRFQLVLTMYVLWHDRLTQ